MGTYEIPRNVKGEGRLLYIFSTKSLIYTAAFGVVGLIFYWILSLCGLKTVGIVIAVIIAAIGYSIGMFKMPEIGSFAFTKKTGGENIDDIIKRAISFKSKKSRIYVYTKEEKENGDK